MFGSHTLSTQDSQRNVVLRKNTLEIALRDVAFSYDKKNPVLENINLNIRQGEMLGIVGPSGAGKTTLVNLLCCFYECDNGTITIGGEDINRISNPSLRKHMIHVGQEIFLFNCSIRENLLMMQPDASLEDIRASCKLAHIDGMIEQCPDKYETLVGERGIALSCGEQQRVCLARALLRQPAILILDEAIEFVDEITLRDIRKNLGALRERGVTVIISTHRSSMVTDCDSIIVLEKGGIVEEGSHRELLLHQELYSRLFHHSISQ